MFILISVVIPTHKRGDIVVKAVESVINSVELPEEIIVVEDRTCEARDTLSDYISEGKVQYHRKNHGVSGASATRNFGVSKASETYVLFLDDDDTFFADKHEARDFLLDRVHRVMCKNKQMHQLYKIKDYRRNITLKMFHFLREFRYSNFN